MTVSPATAKLRELLGGDTATRKLLMHMNTGSQPHRSAYEYTNGDRRVVVIRQGDSMEYQWGEDLYAHWKHEDGAWVLAETNEEPAGG